MIHLAFLVMSAFAICNLSTLVIISELTPADLKQRYSDELNTLYLDPGFTLEQLKDYGNIELMIDLTLSQKFFIRLDEIADYFSVVYLTITRKNDNVESKKRFYVHADQETESNCFKALASFLNWDKFGIISSLDEQNWNWHRVYIKIILLQVL